jgi:hypothetical protein
MTDVNKTLAERGGRYGKFEDNAATAQELKGIVRSHLFNYGDKDLAPDQMEALDMICHKIARIVNGDPNYVDSWVDIAGYAKLVADRLEGNAH